MKGPSAQNNNADSSVSRSSEKSKNLLISKKRIIKNLMVICLGFLLLFVAYNGLSMLQSTMNQQHGIGVASQAIIYAGFCISSFLFPKYVIKKIGCKNTLLIAMIGYIPYIASNFYFNWITMVPSAILIGLSASLIWSSQCTYFNESSLIYSALSMDQHSVKQLNGTRRRSSKMCPCTVLGSSGCTNNDIKSNARNLEICEDIATLQNTNSIQKGKSKTLYSNHKEIKDLIDNNVKRVNKSDMELKEVVQLNINNLTSNTIKTNEYVETQKIDEISVAAYSEEHSKVVSSVTARFFGMFGLVYRTSDVWSNLMSYYILQDRSELDNVTGINSLSCGASFCNIETNFTEPNLAEPNQEMRNVLTGTSVLLAVIASILVFLCLDELETNRKPVKFSFSMAMATWEFIKKKEALLLLPLSAYIGLFQAFYIADFTKSFIACAWGVYHIGLVTIAYGLSSAFSSSVAGLLVKYVGRIPVMMSAALVNAGIHIFLLAWNPQPDRPALFFVAAVALGMSIGILWSQLRAFYGIIFKEDEEVAFAGFYLWDSIGYCVSFSYSNYICTHIKIYILLLVSTVGILGYLKTEFVHRRQRKQ